jgi:hypothetical protein
VAYDLSGRESEAKDSAKIFLQRYPDFSLQILKHILMYKDPDINERIINALRRAGIPEISSNMPQS